MEVLLLQAKYSGEHFDTQTDLTETKGMDKMEELRIVLLGKTGVGKSSVGNEFLGEEVFTGACSVNSGTQICERAEKVINGRRIVVIDTPGIFCTNRSEKDLKKEIISCLVECAPGPHVFIVVLKVDRYTEENQQTVEKLLEYFTDKIYPHMILLFTHGEDLDENMEIQHFIHQPDGEKNMSTKCNLENVAKTSGDRVHLVDNKHWNENSSDSALIDRLKKLNHTEQAIRELTEKMKSKPAEQKTPWFDLLSEQSHNVETEHQNVIKSDEQRKKVYRSNRYQLTQLMKSVKNILKENKGQHYSNEALEEVGKAINVEVEKILQEMGVERETVDMVEIKRKARERVRNKLGKKLVGVAVGTLLGAFLGVGVGIAAPVVMTAGLIGSLWRALTQSHPQGCFNLTKITFGTVFFVAGSVPIVLTTVLTATLGAGAGIIVGAKQGGASGYEQSKTATNPMQAAKKASQTALKNARDFLKECWDAGNTYTRLETELLIDDNKYKQE